MKRFLVSVVFSVAGLAAARSLSAQGDSHRVALAAGALAYEGVRGEAGIGLGASLRYTPGVWSHQITVEAGVHALSAFAQTCTLSIPGSCNPESPSSPIGHVRLLFRRSIGASAPVYFSVSVGAFGPVGRADDPSSVVIGLEGGLGVRLSKRVALEGGYLNFRTSRAIGWALPLNLVWRL